MASVGDLCTLAHREDEATWVNVVNPNIQHVVASILEGMACLNSNGFQHSDLKGAVSVFNQLFFCLHV